MRAATGELNAVRAAGLLVRYAVMGDGAIVIVELPKHGSKGTQLEEPCVLEHWGIVMSGSVRLDGAGHHTYGPGSAFYVKPGPPAHRFEADGPAVLAGFAPLTVPINDSRAAFRARGITPVREPSVVAKLPATVHLDRARSASVGEIQTQSVTMGDYLFTVTTYGRLSGYTDDWCDLPHWGMVLDGDLILRFEGAEMELLGAGDAFYCPSGPPGHLIEVADAAAIVDYTPLAALDDPARRRALRTLAARPPRRARASRRPNAHL
ncbi:MAG TPA: hypothetical protein VFW92_04935 [Candidatus Limnocylindrales bacterium]|nr:hypothetical protein [Candidatus Limnocylindrales bacterium]